MRYTAVPIHLARPRGTAAWFGTPLPRLGAEQRDSLCRGVTFLAVLALSCLLIAYAPLVCGDPNWAAAGVMSRHPIAASASSVGSHAVSPR